MTCDWFERRGWFLDDATKQWKHSSSSAERLDVKLWRNLYGLESAKISRSRYKYLEHYWIFGDCLTLELVFNCRFADMTTIQNIVSNLALMKMTWVLTRRAELMSDWIQYRNASDLLQVSNIIYNLKVLVATLHMYSGKTRKLLTCGRVKFLSDFEMYPWKNRFLRNLSTGSSEPKRRRS